MAASRRYIVRIIKNRRTHGKFGPYSNFEAAKADAQALADSAGKGVNVYVEVEGIGSVGTALSKRKAAPKRKRNAGLSSGHGLSRDEEAVARREIQDALLAAFKNIKAEGGEALKAARKNRIGVGHSLLDAYKASPGSVGFHAVRQRYLDGASASPNARRWLNTVTDARWDTLITRAFGLARVSKSNPRGGEWQVKRGLHPRGAPKGFTTNGFGSYYEGKPYVELSRPGSTPVHWNVSEAWKKRNQTRGNPHCNPRPKRRRKVNSERHAESWLHHELQKPKIDWDEIVDRGFDLNMIRNDALLAGDTGLARRATAAIRRRGDARR